MNINTHFTAVKGRGDRLHSWSANTVAVSPTEFDSVTIHWGVPSTVTLNCSCWGWLKRILLPIHAFYHLSFSSQIKLRETRGGTSKLIYEKALAELGFKLSCSEATTVPLYHGICLNLKMYKCTLSNCIGIFSFVTASHPCGSHTSSTHLASPLTKFDHQILKLNLQHNKAYKSVNVWMFIEATEHWMFFIVTPFVIGQFSY